MRSFPGAPPVNRSKYHAKKTLFNGVMYDSQREADVARTLELLRSATDPSVRVVKIERQVHFELQPPPERIVYRLDFRITRADGSVEHIEVKGFETPSWRIKKKLMRQKYPHITLKII